MPRHLDLPIEERLLGFRVIDPLTGCWRTNGCIAANGYAVITIHKKYHHLHRVSASVFLGLDLNDRSQTANHKSICPNRDCFNPDHLYLGNQSRNVQDSVRQKTHIESRKTHCPQGHEYTLENTIIRRNKRYCRACHKYYNSKEYKLQKEKRN
jgi:hypothetical protein